ncbi:class I SAM-dependent methyltransferase [Candidatus Pelagibacter sp.]|uniref:class I SAM-dependent methyltransferase n=1 Tax=Candidatus Pelagibacter sp. TaxID=2024849 RepID=UPI003F85DEB2
MKNLNSVISLYNQNFHHKDEFKKVIWGSEKSMRNRHRLFFKLLKKKNYNRWLDIGSGTGIIFQSNELNKIKIKKIHALEVNKNLCDLIKVKKIQTNLKIINNDIMKYKTNLRFNLISAIGVLQNSGYFYDTIIKKLISLMHSNCEVFITSKNVLWKNLNKKLKIKSNHEWIDPFDIIRILNKNKIIIKKFGGFKPELNKCVKLHNSSNFFIHAKKK